MKVSVLFLLFSISVIAGEKVTRQTQIEAFCKQDLTCINKLTTYLKDDPNSAIIPKENMQDHLLLIEWFWFSEQKKPTRR